MLLHLLRQTKGFVSMLYRAVTRLSLLLSCTLIAGVTNADEQALDWKAGVSTVNITPNEPLLMSGYASREKPATGLLTDLWVKVLVLEDAKENRAVLITSDLIGVNREFSQQVCQELRARYGLDRSQIAICTSHTHTGPVLGKVLLPMYLDVADDEMRRKIANYTAGVQSKIVNAVHYAINQLEPCSLSWGNGTTTFATNRRENRPEQEAASRRTNGTLKGPTDHDVPVLVVRDARNQLRAVVFGYACHATTLDTNEWSGDYPGFAQIELERLYPGATALFWAGCGADQNPIPRRTVTLAKHYGRRLANAVDAVIMTQQMAPIPSQLETTYQEIDLAFAELPTPEQLQKNATSDHKYEAARAKMLLAQLAKGQPVPSTYPYPIGTWILGDDIQFLFLGGEVVVDFALRFKASHRGHRTWVAGYANDVMGYIPSLRVLREGGYEGGGAMAYYGLPSPWSPTVEKLIADEVHHQLQAERN